MHRGTKIARIFGIDVSLHYSWWFIFILLAWSLSTAFFPAQVPDLTTKTYWTMGVISALLLFVSVLLHELSHSLVARAKKIKVESITLFFFGGVAGITSEDMKPSTEFWMAIAGPLFSLFLSGIFYLISINIVNPIAIAITSYLFQINLIVAIFNLVPGFPLDGGRAFRALLYAYFKDLQKATYIASRGGRLVGLLLVAFGLYGVFTGVGGGLWFVLIGGFLYIIAGASYSQVVFKGILEQVPISQVVRKNISTVTATTSVASFLKKYKTSQEDVFFVKSKNFQGLVELDILSKIVLNPIQKVQSIAVPLTRLPRLTIKDTAYKASQLLQQTKLKALPVYKGKEVMGFVTQFTLSARLNWEILTQQRRNVKRALHKVKKRK